MKYDFMHMMNVFMHLKLTKVTSINVFSYAFPIIRDKKNGWQRPRKIINYLFKFLFITATKILNQLLPTSDIYSVYKICPPIFRKRFKIMKIVL